MIAKLGSYRGGDPAHLRTTEISSSGFKAFVAEEQSADAELGHIAESINFLALDSSSGSLDGSAYSTVDTTAPSAPTSLTTTATRTSDTTPTITGSAEASSTVKLYSGTTLLGSGTADSNGAFSITTSTLSEGDYALTATATDAAGNTSSSSDSYTITIDTTAPSAPTSLTTTATAEDSTPTITGSAEAGSTVKLYNGTTLLGTATADSNGAFSITTSTLANGDYGLTATATDAAGNASSSSDSLSITVNSTSSTLGEYGTLDLDHNWKTVSFNNSYTNPVVIVSDPSFNGGDPGNIRIRNVGSSSFEARFQEPNYKDGAHITEQASYVVVESGEWEMADGTRFSAGTTTSNKLTSAGFETITFDNSFSDTPSLLTQVQSYNEEDWVITRVDNITGQSFEVSMQEEQSLMGGSHATETIGWFAIDSGAANDGDTILEGGITGNTFDHGGAAGSFSASFTDAPSLIAKLGSYRGGDPAHLRTTEISSSGFKAFVAEEQSADKELGHIAESINFLALNSSSGSLDGSAYSTVDTKAPNAPTSLTTTATRTSDTTPTITGSAEAGSTVKIYSGTTLLGSGTADSNGSFSITTSTLSKRLWINSNSDRCCR